MFRAFLSLLTLVSVASCSAAPVTLFVAPDGNDAWSGSLQRPDDGGTDGPLATVVAARDRLRALRGEGKLTEGARVQLAAGVYRLETPLAFGPLDSGTDAAPIVYSGAPEWQSLISGGMVISGWSEVEPGLWVAAVPQDRGGMWPLRSLYVNGSRATLARSPSTGYFRTVGAAAPFVDAHGNETNSSKSAFRFKPGDLENWDDLAGANICVFYHWETGLLPIKSVDDETSTVTLGGEMKWPFWANQRYYVEGTKAALDAPGEWYLDRAEGLLYYRPRPDEDMATAEVVAPWLTQLVLLQGDRDAGLPVENLRFEGLSFQHTNYVLEPTGHSDWQAAVTVNAALQADGARRCVLDGCEVTHLGNYAIWFRRGCLSNEVTHCYVHDCSAGGVRIGTDGIPQVAMDETGGNVVSDNLIRDLGIDFYGAIPMWIGQSSDNTIAHNEICDSNYSGISCGWTWGFAPTGAHRNRIEYNYLHDLGRGKLCDMAAIYTLGTSPGTVIRGNLIHDIWDWEEGYGAGGIYPDEGSSDILIESNVTYRTASGGLTVHYGRRNTARNNIFALGRDGQIHLGRRDQESSLTFERNIVYFEEGALFQRESDLTADYNLYYHTEGEELTFPLDLDFAAWQAKGMDVHSVIADPGFADPQNGDFRLPEDSPALKLGFVPIDTSLAGITGPPELVALARSIQRPPATKPTRAQAQPISIDDGFENTPLQGQADLAITHGEAGSASIRVTDEIAATGKRSLRFTDAPGLDQVWNPHLYYHPHQRGGTATCSFDLWLEPGAILCHEWRDASSPFRVGPTMAVDGEGRLSAATEPVMQLPHKQWVHFELSSVLGKDADGTWKLTVTVPGREPEALEDLPCDPKCKTLEWLGFISNATDTAVLYLDNLKLDVVE